MDFLELFEVLDMDDSFKKPLYVVFGFMVDELEGFKDFSHVSSILSAIVNATKFAQNYPKLPNLPKDN